MNFWDFFGWYVLAKLIWVFAPVALVAVLVAAVYLAGGLGLQANRFMARVWKTTGPDDEAVFADDDEYRERMLEDIRRQRQEGRNE